MPPHTAVFVGIDVAKAEFVVACRPEGHSWTSTNDARGVATTLARLQTLSPALVVVESTGGYELALTESLTVAQVPVVAVNPRQVRDFGKATGQLAKTDRLDAQLLALFAERVRPTPRPRRSAERQRIADLVARRRQLRDMRVAELNRLAHAAHRESRRPPARGRPRRPGMPRQRAAAPIRPHTRRLPRSSPLSYASGATPAKAATCRRPSEPSSGKSIRASDFGGASPRRLV